MTKDYGQRTKKLNCFDGDVICQTQHFKKFCSIFFDIGKNNLCACFGCRVNYTEKNRNADAVYEFGFGKIYHEIAAACVNTVSALAFYLFAAQFI